jgi:hypothetical protein
MPPWWRSAEIRQRVEKAAHKRHEELMRKPPMEGHLELRRLHGREVVAEVPWHRALASTLRQREAILP